MRKKKYSLLPLKYLHLPKLSGKVFLSEKLKYTGENNIEREPSGEKNKRRSSPIGKSQMACFSIGSLRTR
jgi:hypothetical protein